MITVDQGDWDMHTGLGTLELGRMAATPASSPQPIAAFFTDLGALGDKVTLVTLSEFGRRVKENANYGLDHGYGNVMFLAGAGVKGGQYYGTLAGPERRADADLAGHHRLPVGALRGRRSPLRGDRPPACSPASPPEPVGAMPPGCHSRARPPVEEHPQPGDRLLVVARHVPVDRAAAQPSRIAAVAAATRSPSYRSANGAR